MKTHTFVLRIKTNQSRRDAERAFLTCMALRQPDFCEMHLISRSPTKKAVSKILGK